MTLDNQKQNIAEEVALREARQSLSRVWNELGEALALRLDADYDAVVGRRRRLYNGGPAASRWWGLDPQGVKVATYRSVRFFEPHVSSLSLRF